MSASDWKKLLGVEDENVVEDDEIVTTLTQAREDEKEYSPEWIEEMEKMMAAYDKKKMINSSFARPSFVLDGFKCPDPFAIQQTQGAEGSGRGAENNNAETVHDAPVVAQHADDQPGDDDQPEDDDQPGDIPIHKTRADDIPNTYQTMMVEPNLKTHLKIIVQ